MESYFVSWEERTEEQNVFLLACLNAVKTGEVSQVKEGIGQ